MLRQSDVHEVWLSTGLRALVTELTAAVRDGQRLLVLTGDIGCGKTTVANAVVSKLEDAIAVVGRLSYPVIEPRELYRLLGQAFGIDAASAVTRDEFLAELRPVRRAAKARDAVLLIVVDEAQQVDPDVIAEIARLATLDPLPDEAPLSALLVGGEDLPWLSGERRYRVRPMVDDEIRGFLRWRLELGGFDPRTVTSATVREIAKLTGGVPRLVERVADVVLRDAVPPPREMQMLPAVPAAARNPTVDRTENEWRSVAQRSVARRVRRAPVTGRAVAAVVVGFVTIALVYASTAPVQVRDRARHDQRDAAPSKIAVSSRGIAVPSATASRLPAPTSVFLGATSVSPSAAVPSEPAGVASAPASVVPPSAAMTPEPAAAGASTPSAVTKPRSPVAKNALQRDGTSRSSSAVPSSRPSPMTSTPPVTSSTPPMVAGPAPARQMPDAAPPPEADPGAVIDWLLRERAR